MTRCHFALINLTCMIRKIPMTCNLFQFHLSVLLQTSFDSARVFLHRFATLKFILNFNFNLQFHRSAATWFNSISLSEFSQFASISSSSTAIGSDEMWNKSRQCQYLATYSITLWPKRSILVKFMRTFTSECGHGRVFDIQLFATLSHNSIISLIQFTLSLPAHIPRLDMWEFTKWSDQRCWYEISIW